MGQTSILESTIKNAQTNLLTANEQYCEPAELVAWFYNPNWGQAAYDVGTKNQQTHERKEFRNFQDNDVIFFV